MPDQNEDAVAETANDAPPATGTEDLVSAGLSALDALGEAPAEDAGEVEPDDASGDEPDETLEADASEPDVKDTAANDDEDGETPPKDKSAWLSPEDFKRLPKPAQERIRTLDRQRREYRDQVEGFRRERDEAAARVEEYSASHERVQTIDTFMETNGVSNEEFVNLLEFGARIKSGDHQRAWEIVQPYVELLQQATGATLPSDLQTMVDDGELSPEAAKRFAVERGQRTAAEARAQRATAEAQTVSDRERQAQSQQQAAALQKAIVDAGNAEAEAIMSKDQGFDRSLVGKEIVRLRTQLNVTIDTPEKAKAIVREAYQNVRAQHAPKPGLPRPGSQPGSRRGSREPATAMEAAQAALDALG